MHESVMKFGHDHLTPEMVKGKRVLEVGSMNVNGSLRTYIEAMCPLQYLGIDLQKGDGVDWEVDFCSLTPVQAKELFGEFDLIVSTEMLEHAEHWRAAINNMKAVLKPRGWLLLTTRGVGFPRHGYPSDYWRFDCKDMQSIFADCNLKTITDPQVPGVFVLAQKLTDEVAVDLSKIVVYSMNPATYTVPTATYTVPTSTTSPRIAGMLRVKNESRWIEQVIKSIKPLCNAGIFVLDDHSTDNTVELAEHAGACTLKSKFTGINETRDKTFLLKHIIEMENPDWVLHIDGDEELEPAGIDAIRQAIDSNRAIAYALQVLYLWNDEHTIRTDGIFGNFTRASLFSTRHTNGVFNPTIHGQGTAANLHCANVPADMMSALTIPARLIHYGYIDRDMRLKKWDFYNTIDPNNVIEDRYRHAVTGDIPEVPATIRTKWAGPLTLAPYMKVESVEVVNA